MTKLCSKCGEERPTRGFLWHERYCKGTLKVKFPKQAAILSPEAYAMYVSKAEARI